jgi:HTH-type transcriptional regulator / antitoxin HigA
MNAPYHAKMSENYIAVPPGTTIEEQLEIGGITKQEFVNKMGMSERFIDELIDGNVPLTDEIAIKLEKVLGGAAYFWNNLEKGYREDLAKVNEENRRNEEAKRRWRYGNSSVRWNTLSVSRV